ncbi:hypothetical protein BV25DRAFT_167549 [Artomyces pyxidatus]|uniref:Uncharacterized protein n=1 Tax=Artomyces pyxidatus TaxID=48021 RepID=A0ACB8SIB7_9AGAM|nr:hypothetical protein BV25DRAFT_167549 [Artomyces pyxidatus]
MLPARTFNDHQTGNCVPALCRRWINDGDAQSYSTRRRQMMIFRPLLNYPLPFVLGALFPASVFLRYPSFHSTVLHDILHTFRSSFYHPKLRSRLPSTSFKLSLPVAACAASSALAAPTYGHLSISVQN